MSNGLIKSKALVCNEVGKPFSLRDVYIDQKDIDDNQAIVEFKASGIWCVYDADYQGRCYNAWLTLLNAATLI
jgi:Zn-dependent alcohol dehydrogenase